MTEIEGNSKPKTKKLYKYRVVKGEEKSIGKEGQGTPEVVVSFYRNDSAGNKTLEFHSSNGLKNPADKHSAPAPAEWVFNEEEHARHTTEARFEGDKAWLSRLTDARFKEIKNRPEKQRPFADAMAYKLAKRGKRKGKYRVDENGFYILANEHRVRLVEVFEEPIMESD